MSLTSLYIILLFLISQSLQDNKILLNINHLNHIHHPTSGIYILQFLTTKTSIYFQMKSLSGNPSLFAYLCNDVENFNPTKYDLIDFLYKGSLFIPSRINNYFTSWLTIPKPNTEDSKDQYIFIIECDSECIYEFYYLEERSPNFSTSNHFQMQPDKEYTIFTIDSDTVRLSLNTSNVDNPDNKYINVEIASYVGTTIFYNFNSRPNLPNLLGSSDYSINKIVFRKQFLSNNTYTLSQHTASSESYMHVKFWFSDIGDYLYKYTHELGKTQIREVFPNNSTYITFPFSQYENCVSGNIHVFIYTDQCFLIVNDGNGNIKEGTFFYYEYNITDTVSDITYIVDLKGSNDFNESFVPSQEEIDNGFTEYCSFLISSTDNSDNYRIVLGDGFPTQLQLIPGKLNTIKCIYPYIYEQYEETQFVCHVDIPMFSKVTISIRFGEQGKSDSFEYTLTESKDIMLGNVAAKYCRDENLCPIKIEINNLLNIETHITITPKIAHLTYEYVPKNTYKFISLYKDVIPTFYFRANNYEKGKIMLFYDKGIIIPRYNIFTYTNTTIKNKIHSLDKSNINIDSYYKSINYNVNLDTCEFGCFGHLHFNDESILTDNGAYPIRIGFIIQRANELIHAEVNQTIPGVLEYDEELVTTYAFTFTSNINGLVITLEGRYAEFGIRDLNEEQTIFEGINKEGIETWNADNNVVILHYKGRNEQYEGEEVKLEIWVKKGKGFVRKEEFELDKEFRMKVEPIVMEREDIVYYLNSNRMEICRSVNGVCYYVYEMNAIEKSNNEHYDAFIKSQIWVDDITIQLHIIDINSFTNDIQAYFTNDNHVHTYHNGNEIEFTFTIESKLYVNIDKPLLLFKIVSSQNEQFLHFGLAPHFRNYYRTSITSHQHLLYSTFETEEGVTILADNINDTLYDPNDNFILYINAFKGSALISVYLPKKYGYEESSKRQYQINTRDSVKIVLHTKNHKIMVVPFSNVEGVSFEFFLTGRNTKNIFYDITNNYKTINYMFYNTLENELKFNLIYNIKQNIKDMKYNVKVRGDYNFVHNKKMFLNENERCIVKGQFINKEQIVEIEKGDDIDIKGDDEMLIMSYEMYGVYILNTKSKGNDDNYFYIGVECQSNNNSFTNTTFNVQIMPNSGNDINKIVSFPQLKYFYSYFNSNEYDTLYLNTFQQSSDIGSNFIIEYSSCITDNIQYELFSIDNNQPLSITNLNSKFQYGKHIISFTLTTRTPYIIFQLSPKSKSKSPYLIPYILKYKSINLSILPTSPFLYNLPFLFNVPFTSHFTEEHITTHSKQPGILSEWGFLLNNISSSIITPSYIFTIHPHNSINNPFICSSYSPIFAESINDEYTFTLFYEHPHNKFNYTLSLLAYFTLEGGEEVLMNGGVNVVEYAPSRLIVYLLGGFGGILIVVLGVFLWLLKQIRMIEKNNEAYIVDEEEEEFEEEIEVAYDFDEMRSRGSADI